MNLAYENVKEVDCLDISREGCDAWEAAVRRYEDRIGMYSVSKVCSDAQARIMTQA